MNFVEARDLLLSKAREYYKRHRDFSENWKEGKISKIWIDAKGDICIEYESGKWWHYKESGEWY